MAVPCGDQRDWLFANHYKINIINIFKDIDVDTSAATDKKLIIARDRLGVKPLYYWFKNNHLIFASEIKSILQYEEVKREINYEGLSQFEPTDTVIRYVPKLFKLIWGNSSEAVVPFKNV